GENVLLETDAADATQYGYTLEPALYGNLVSQYRVSTAAAQYFHFDGLGSTDRLTSAAGAVGHSNVYDAFGRIVQSQTGIGVVNVFRYVGRLGYYYDAELTQYYVRARHYDPRRGRFLSKDLMEPSIRNIALYSYADNSPVMLIDPSGEVSRV